MRLAKDVCIGQALLRHSKKSRPNGVVVQANHSLRRKAHSVEEVPLTAGCVTHACEGAHEAVAQLAFPWPRKRNVEWHVQ